jgi:hypothetical protein
MRFSSDERVLAILYGDGTREGLKEGLSRLRDDCGRGDRRLKRMAERLLAKMETMTDGDIHELTEVP